MSTTRRAEFFAVEAEEYLLDLELLASVHEVPDGERLVRGARALRGAALVAGLGTFARVAAGLETLVRKLRDGGFEWDAGVREQCMATIAALLAMLPRARNWDSLADTDALALAERIERFTGRGPRPETPTAPHITPGVRAFIAKESALIASSLEQAARALSPLPPPEALAAVLERMRSLRGLGASAELSPLPEMLDAMEIATRTLLGEDPPPPDVGALFDEAARALAAMARAIAENGRVVIPAELDRVAMHLLTAYAEEPDVVSITALAPDDADSILHAGLAPSPPDDATPVPIELVGVGDHLLRAVDALERPAPAVVRDLRLFVLHRTLATMPSRSATGQFLAPLTGTISQAIASGAASRQPERFLLQLRTIGQFLMEHGSTHDLEVLLRARDHLIASPTQPAPIPTTPSPAAVALTAEVEVEVDEIVSIESLAPDARSVMSDELDIVPIESLAPELLVVVEEEETEIVEIAALAPDDIVSIESLAPDVVEEAISGAGADDEELVGTPIVHIEALAYDDDRASAGGLIPGAAPGEPSRLESAFRRRHELELSDASPEPSLERLLEHDIHPIDALLYRGRAALARAAEVRATISQRLSEPGSTLDAVRPDLEELFDLVALARDAA